MFRVLSRRYPGTSDSAIALHISDISVNQHDAALELLEKLSNSFFFQIDQFSDVALSLLKARTRLPYRRAVRGTASLNLQFPEREYDRAPISLFWYARSAFGMPLLQFLAYYQVLEFYFPTFSQAEAKRRAQVILKDPTFRVDRDADVGRLLAALNMKGRGFGDERSQLRSVINACIDENELRRFLEATEARKSFFSSKQKGLTDRKIPLANPDIDIRNDVADLIYEIRCRVVHTKGDTTESELELLLPFSKEAELMEPYIDLLNLLASRVLVSTSSPFSP